MAGINIEKQNAVELLKAQIQGLRCIGPFSVESPNYINWRQKTNTIIAMIFGENSRQYTDAKAVWFVSRFGTDDKARQQTYDTEAFRNGVNQMSAILEACLLEVEMTSFPAAVSRSALDRIRQICERFHLAVEQLKIRHNHRPTLFVQDEYDVQDVLHTLLEVEFDDIRPEEWTPSYAGAGSRMDFLLRKEEIVVEAKMAREGLNAKKLGEELLVDIARYKEHPHCKTLVCLVYDPERKIRNPAGVAHDLMQSSQIPVIVHIVPRGY